MNITSIDLSSAYRRERENRSPIHNTANMSHEDQSSTYKNLKPQSLQEKSSSEESIAYTQHCEHVTWTPEQYLWKIFNRSPYKKNLKPHSLQQITTNYNKLTTAYTWATHYAFYSRRIFMSPAYCDYFKLRNKVPHNPSSY